LPKGGGAIQGIGETFQHDAFSGTATWTIPIPVTPGRGGFGPELALSYGSGGGNGIFGLGWELSLPRIARKTDLGLPRYDERDAFVLSGAEELVVQTDRGGAAESVRRGGFVCERFRPRLEGLFARIERWTDDATGDVQWRATTRGNTTSVYGRTRSARIADPSRPGRVFAWLLEETFDARGNHLLYEYAGDDPSSSDYEIFEDRRVYAQRYLRRVFYGNLPAGVTDDAGAAVGIARTGVDHRDLIGTLERRYALEVVFDYGGSTGGPAADTAAPELFGASDPPRRTDRFSTYRPGWELRTLRRCERVLVYHRFAELGGAALVRSTRFGYRSDAETGLSLLESVTVAGHQADGFAEMPPVTFRYGGFRPREQRFRSLSSHGLGLPPAPLSARDLALVDLFGDGAPDLLQTTPAGWRYWKNLGDGEFDEPRMLSGAPAGLALDDPGVALADLDGDGRLEVLQRGDLSGFFRAGPEGPFARFERFPTAPPFDPADPNLRFIDLTGDGRADALLLSDNLLYWFENRGVEGFAPAETLPRLHDLDEFPDLFLADPSGRVHLADMNGDGLVDVVLAHQGRVDYWPNLGYGRFGRRVTMASLPAPPGLSPLFDPKRVLLADVNGNGCADLVYLDFDRIHVWFNRSGNGWSAPTTIDGTPQAAIPDNVRAADLFGTGTATLVWSYPFGLFPGSHYKAIDLCGGVKPFLLEEMDNGLGAITRVAYATSTRFALTDAREGTPWATRLPFPVQVVARVETVEQVGRTRLVSSYGYRHGHFDAAEREFRGFARVERLDTEQFESFAAGAAEASENARREHHVPPVRTVTWHHTGAYLEEGDALGRRLAREFYTGDGQAPLLADHDVETADAPAEAHRALKGTVLRRETYALDGPPRAAHPFVVESHACTVRALQPRRSRARGVFLRTPRESLVLRYERDPGDPRLVHTLTLEVDDFGNVTRSAVVAYPRRRPGAEPEQQRALAVFTAMRFINTPETPPAAAAHHYVGVACESRRYEIAGLETLIPGGALVTRALLRPLTRDLDDFVPIEGDVPAGKKRLLEWTRTYFKRDAAADLLAAPHAFGGRLALGAIEPLALAFETCRAVLTPGLRAALYGAEVTDVDLRDAGYVGSAALDGTLPAQAAGLQWAAGGRQATDRARFHLPVLTQDAFGARSTVEYDRYALALVRTLDPLANETRVVETDYRLLRPRIVSDPNGNRASVAFDALGFMVGSAIAGKSGEGDNLAGFRPNPGPAEIDAFFADPAGRARALLGDASTRVVYDLHRQHQGRGPARAATIVREVHASDPGGSHSALQISVQYGDGFGRIAQTRALTDPGEIEGVAVPERWIVSGWVIVNNKGQPVQRFEPFFSATRDFEFAPLHGVASTIFYDPFGRPVVTLRPEGCYEKRLPGPWEEVRWDANDTVRLRPQADPDVAGYVAGFVAARPGFQTWLERRLPDPANPPPPSARTPEQDAAVATLAHAGTPVVERLDPLGRAFLTRQDLGPRQIETRIVLDVDGRARRITDPRGVTAFEHAFDMAGRTLHMKSVDAGQRTMFLAADDKPVLSVDANGSRSRTRYDALRRVLDVRVTPPGGSPFVASRAVYGETLGAAARDTNHRTRLLRTIDGAGVVTQSAYDFKGNLRDSRRAFFPDHRRLPDWDADVMPPGAPEFHLHSDYDALDRQVEVRSPDGSRTLRRFSRSGELIAVDVHHRGATPALTVVAAVDHNPRGQRTRTTLGNGVVVEHDYDPETFRLRRLQAQRGGTFLQDLSYVYDPVGNVSRCTDGAFETVFNANQRIDPAARYTYDALYRLVDATGREHEGVGACGHDQDWSRASLCSGGSKQAPFVALTPQPVSNGRALRNYLETYKYDDAGNLQEIGHRAGARGSWTRTQTFAAGSNRLDTSEADCPGERHFTVPHDANGNVTAMAHLPELRWDHANRLVRVRLAGTSGDAAFYAYDDAGQRTRKVLERGGSPSCTRLYLDGFERFIDHAAGADPATRETLHIMDGGDRLAVLEAWTEGGRDERRVRFQLSNHLRSSLLELDEGGNAISYEEYRPYGDTAYLAGASFVAVQRKRYRYSGKERDDETGLCYYGARYYAPWLGRWVTADSTSRTDSANLYLFVSCNPIRMSDPSGQQAEDESSPIQTDLNADAPAEPQGPKRLLMNGDRMSLIDSDTVNLDSPDPLTEIDKARERIAPTYQPPPQDEPPAGGWGQVVVNTVPKILIDNPLTTILLPGPEGAEIRAGLVERFRPLPYKPSEQRVGEMSEDMLSLVIPGPQEGLSAMNVGTKIAANTTLRVVGEYRVVRQLSKRGVREADHIVANAVNPFPKEQALSMSMKYEHHRPHLTTGSSAEAQAFRETLRQVIEKDPVDGFHEAHLIVTQLYIDEYGLEYADAIYEALLELDQLGITEPLYKGF
jgi:RHS repeat-associated protein